MGNFSDLTRAPPPPSLPLEEDRSSADERTTKIGEILSKYPESHAKLVKELIRRGAAPVRYFADSQPTSVQEAMGEISRLHDRQQAEPFNGKPYPLPGDFIRLDPSQTCDFRSEEHRERRCLCIAQTELFNALFVAPTGPTLLGRRIIDCALPGPEQFGLQDAFGNTLLHLLAARNQINSLGYYLRHDSISRIINHQNSAGQTFLHVLDFRQTDLNRLCSIVD